MNTNNNSPTLFPEDQSPDMRALILEIHGFIKDLKEDYDKFVADVRLDRPTMQELLGVSPSTLARWRARGVLPYGISVGGASYYLFDDVYAAVKRGALVAKGFKRLDAIGRLKAFKNGLLFKARMNQNQDEE